MNSIYLDNAATTQIDKEVLKVMYASMQNNFGNPSSTHQFGRKAKSTVETARKNIANHFNVSASEIIFTSGGTEADNLILHNAVLNLDVKRIITSKIEHHAVLHTCDYLKKTYNIKIDYVNEDEFGTVNVSHLETLLSNSKEKTLVSLLFINNEVGNILPTNEVCKLCKKYDALFHSDTVQAIGHYKIDLQQTPIDFMVARKLSPTVLFNGISSDLNKSSYIILNVRFPVKDDMLLFSLDMAGIAASGGSACQSGSTKGSHVLSEILNEKEIDKTSIRFSFSKYTTKEEIEMTIAKLKELL